MQNNTTSFTESIFTDFFRQYGYAIFAGSSLLDDSIPMSFVMSAGFVQVEKQIIASGTQPQNITLIQNCFRHFDMGKVGQSPIHLSLFRMMGAFHFGKINPLEHIKSIWQLLINSYHLPAQHLWVTCFAGGYIENHYFEKDVSTCDAWRRIGVPAAHIISNPDKQNFWIQSPAQKTLSSRRKCGTTTEVFFDHGEHLACGSEDCQPGCSCGHFIEIANILFIRYHLLETGQVEPLSTPFTEIVIGAERLAIVKQSTEDIFHIDMLLPLVSQIETAISTSTPNPQYVYIIADHIRSLAFLFADGAPPPGKGGRAFIIRKLMREIFTALKILGITDDTFLPHLVNTAIRLYSPIHPGIQGVRDNLLCHLAEESQRFERTLQRGERRLARLFSQRASTTLTPEDIQFFEKSFGIPEPLLIHMLKK